MVFYIQRTQCTKTEIITQISDHLNTLRRRNGYAFSVPGMVAGFLLSSRNRYISMPMVIPINIEDMLLQDMLNMLKVWLVQYLGISVQHS